MTKSLLLHTCVLVGRKLYPKESWIKFFSFVCRPILGWNFLFQMWNELQIWNLAMFGKSWSSNLFDWWSIDSTWAACRKKTHHKLLFKHTKLKFCLFKFKAVPKSYIWFHFMNLPSHDLHSKHFKSFHTLSKCLESINRTFNQLSNIDYRNFRKQARVYTNTLQLLVNYRQLSTINTILTVIAHFPLFPSKTVEINFIAT